MPRLIFVAVLLGLNGCASAQVAGCPADFDLFLGRFSDDLAFQRAFSAPTVLVVSHAPGEPEETTAAPTPKADLAYPLIPSTAQRRAKGLQEKTQVRGRHATFRFDLPESDAWSMEYRFEQRGCWSLIRVDDQSL